VSPTVWAWREGRVKKIRRAADRVLCIFPFEPDFLRRHGVEARYVGHPLAARYPLQPDRAGARRALELPPEAPVLALLPGSRMGEVARIAPPFLQAAAQLAKEIPGLQVVTPTATEATRERFLALAARHAPGLPLQVHPGRTAEALAAADLALVASGTATFEALLSKRPMVVGYRMNPLSYHLITGLGLLKTERVAMANLLSEEPLAPELLQQACEPGRLAGELLRLWRDEARRRSIETAYLETHRRLRTDTDERAAEAVLELME
jgi:lipid-A-disaccharide synthase